MVSTCARACHRRPFGLPEQVPFAIYKENLSRTGNIGAETATCQCLRTHVPGKQTMTTAAKRDVYFGPMCATPYMTLYADVLK